MFYCINNLPEDIIYQNVIPFLDDSFEEIDYRCLFNIEGDVLNNYDNTYSRRYKVAINKYGDPLRKLIRYNENRYKINFLISRIEKPNKKYRYYLLIEKIQYYCSCDCRDNNCGYILTYFLNYSSVYFEKKINLIILWLTLKTYDDISFHTIISNKLKNELKYL